MRKMAYIFGSTTLFLVGYILGSSNLFNNNIRAPFYNNLNAQPDRELAKSDGEVFKTPVQPNYSNVSSPQSIPDVIIAKKFQLVDDYGNLRGNWYQKPDETAFVMFDNLNKDKFHLSVFPYNTYLGYQDLNGIVRMQLSLLNNNPYLEFTDNYGYKTYASGRLSMGSYAPIKTLGIGKADAVTQVDFNALVTKVEELIVRVNQISGQ